MILFLDFDGVLHPIYSGKGGVTDFRHLPILEDWLTNHPEVNIVISSSWRDTMDLDDLKHIFSIDLRERVIDKCPQYAFEEDEQLMRYKEIQAWITQNDFKGKWLALDDAINEFPADCEQLIYCEPYVGIDADVLIDLTNKYRQLKNDFIS